MTGQHGLEYAGRIRCRRSQAGPKAMTVKRLLCISARGPQALQQQCGTLPGWDVCSVASLREGSAVLAAQRYLVGLMLDLPEAGTPPALDAFLRRHSHLQWVGVPARGMLDDPAWRALVLDHFCDFHTTPLDPARLCHTLGHAHGWASLRAARTPRTDDAVHSIDGQAPAVVALRVQLRKVAQVNAPVLIWGESGSGKELAAQAIHAQSPRASHPFVPINCGALPASLIQSELFGYEWGAFTGTAREKAGLIESANGGTIFLDEIGDLPREIQSNLLPIRVPPLRERKADLPQLAELFFRAYAEDKGAHVKGFSSQALRALQQHDWPGNVRELINCIRRAMVLAESPLIQAADLNLPVDTALPAGDALADTRVRAERDAICVSLANAGKNITHAARELGVSRMTLYRLLAKHNITI